MSQEQSIAPMVRSVLSEEHRESARYLEALEESERRLSLALDSAHMGMWEWDVRSNLSVWSSKEYELLGLPVGDGHEPTDAFFHSIHPEDLRAFKHSLAAVMKEGCEWGDEHRIIRPDGEVRWMTGAGRLYRDPDGQLLRMLGVDCDITERKRTEQALRDSRAMARSIDDLLDVWSIERGKVALHAAELDLARIVQDTVDDYRALFDENGVALDFAAPPALMWAQGDAARISQIVSNLMVNANKFTDRGGHVSVQLMAEDERRAVITVRDTGIGMSPETLRSIFKPLWRRRIEAWRGAVEVWTWAFR